MKKIMLLTMWLVGASAFAQSGVAFNCFNRAGNLSARIWIDETGRYSAQVGGRGLVPLRLSVGDGWQGVYAAPGIVWVRGGSINVGRNAYACQSLTRYGGFERSERTWAF